MFATFNPSDKDSNVTLSNGNLTVAASVNSVWTSVRSTISKSSGKWYWELTLAGTSPVVISPIAKSTAGLNDFLGADANGWGYYSADGKKYTGGLGSVYGATYTAGAVIGFALDMDAGTLTMYKNNVSQGTMVTGLSGEIFAGCSVQNTGFTVTANFGATALTYTPPAGYNAGLFIPSNNLFFAQL